MKIFLLYPYFFTPDGITKKIGGVETYIESLVEVISGMNITPIVCQFSKIPFERPYHDYIVCGYKAKTMKQLYKLVEPKVNKEKDLILFVSDLWASRVRGVKTLSIQHGVYWDIPRTKGPYILYYCQRIKQVLTALIDFHKTKYSVCVDYNFYNWYKTFNVKSETKKFWIVPNFAERTLCQAELKEKVESRTNQIRIIFARRFYEFRGVHIFVEAMKRIMKENSSVCVTFAGEGPAEKYIKTSFESFGNRFSLTKYLPNESFEVHRQYDIAVIPTTGSEGTSLSLLEAMGAGCVVVATPVGGLSNIILDGYNGYISMPTANELYDTITKAINHIDNVELMNHAIDCVRISFSKEKWAETWKQILKEIISD